jgi:hypothetical protein
VNRREHNPFLGRIERGEFLHHVAPARNENSIGQRHESRQVEEMITTALPSSARRLISPWISTIAPTSTLRVGSS